MVEIVNEKQVTKKRRNLLPSQITTFLKIIDLIPNHPNTTRFFGGFNVVHYKRILSRTQKTIKTKVKGKG